MWLPDWLYQLLPYLYVVAGLIAINYFEVMTGYISGLLLIFTAGVVFLMRKDYRQNRIKNKR